MARPRKKIDAEQVEKLAMINCSTAEIGAVLGCSADTLQRRYAAALKNGREKGKVSLKRMMWIKAEGGNTTMMIWLSKNQLGYSDRVEQAHTWDPSEPVKIQWADEDDHTNAQADAPPAAHQPKHTK